MRPFKKYFIFFFLFIITCITTTLAGAEWTYGLLVFRDAITGEITFPNWLTWEKLARGLEFSISFLLFLTCHEFGHYLTARLYKVKVTLPYYIPLWLGVISTIGTMGAFIQIKQNLNTRKEFFDIGIAGPLAGFVIALAVLFYGFTHLPPRKYVFEVNPEYRTDYPKEYEKYGLDYAKYVYNYPDNEYTRAEGIVGQPREKIPAVGTNLIFIFFENYVVEDKSLLPTHYELFHYPYLFAGFLALFFTALNLMPIGQLDGGHILYGLFGYKIHRRTAPILFTCFVYYAGLGLIKMYETDTSDLLVYIPLYFLALVVIFLKVFKKMSHTIIVSLCILLSQILLNLIFPNLEGYGGWLAFAFLLGRVLGIYHPPAQEDKPLDTKRKLLGWLALIIFILCFSPRPIIS